MPRPHRLLRRGSLWSVVLASGAALVGGGAWAERSGWAYVWLPSLAPPPLAGAQGSLLRVIDGDTVVVRYHDLPLVVRLLNVDTQESVHPDPDRNTEQGRATSAWAKAYLAGARVRLEFQRDRWGIATDRHGRALADLWLDHPPEGTGPEDELFQETLIRQGHSAYETGFGPSVRYHARLQRAQQEARRDGLGIWAP